ACAPASHRVPRTKPSSRTAKSRSPRSTSCALTSPPLAILLVEADRFALRGVAELGHAFDAFVALTARPGRGRIANHQAAPARRRTVVEVGAERRRMVGVVRAILRGAVERAQPARRPVVVQANPAFVVAHRVARAPVADPLAGRDEAAGRRR